MTLTSEQQATSLRSQNPVKPDPSFLSELIEEEHHQHLLEAGNIGKRPLAVSWSDENSWVSQGYHARVLRSVCACGAETRALLGIFHEDATPSGKSRSQDLSLRGLQVPILGNYQVRIETAPLSAICPACLPVKGFSSEIFL